jgi:AraC-like DNA-binding protein
MPRVVWTDAVRGIVVEHLDQPELSLRVVARALAVSPRTLQRRLAEEGTSWRVILDTARRERASALLREGLTTELTAAQVGFAGSRALRRALARWREGSLARG